MASGWYGSGGSLLTDEPIDGVTQDLMATSEAAAEWYGRRYFIGESMTEAGAKAICAGLGLAYAGSIAGLYGG